MSSLSWRPQRRATSPEPPSTSMVAYPTGFESAPGADAPSAKHPFQSKGSGMEDILIVGPTGNVGSPLLGQLHAAGHRVRALVRDQRKAEQIASTATPVMGDLAKPETLARAFEGAQRVFIPPRRYRRRKRWNGTLSTRRRAGAKRIVYPFQLWRGRERSRSSLSCACQA